MMARAGIDRALTLSASGVYHNFEKGNAETLAACSEHSQLIPAATVDPRSVGASETKIPQLADEGFAAVRFFPAEQGWHPDLLSFAGMAEAAGDAKLPIIVSAAAVGDVTRLAGLVGSVSVPVILSCASARPLAEALAAAQHFANLYLETSGLLGLGGVSLVAERMGAERLLFGSNAPLFCPLCEIENVASSGLSDADRARVLRGNASAILGLERKGT